MARTKTALASPLRALVIVLLLGCSRSTEAPPAESQAPGVAAVVPAERTRLVVFAASSLTDAFNDLEKSFEAENADVDVALSYGGSQVLALQLSEGAPGDVFASADEKHMQRLVTAGLAEPSQPFATNELVIVVPKDNPAQIAQLKDLPRARRLVLGSANVPVGVYTRELLARANASLWASFEKDVLAHVVSEESNVRLVRAKVELGEADAAVVYRTDASSSKQLAVVPIPAELNVKARYPIAVLRKAHAQEPARRWVAHVLSARGRAALGARGFLVDR
jgi:molybdate transport system substrate-binding protein